MEPTLRRNLFIVMGAIAAGAVVASLLTILLALDQTPLILLVMVGVLIAVIVGEIVLYILGRRDATPQDEPLDAEIVEDSIG